MIAAIAMRSKAKLICATFLARVKEHRLVLTVLGLVLSVFFGTNWYFSPQARFLRSAETALKAVSDRIYQTAEEKGLRETVGYFGQRGRYVHCGSESCQVLLILGFRWDSEGQQPISTRPSVSVEVSARLRPLASDMRAIGLLPPAFEWQELGWTWEVLYTATNEERSYQRFRGRWGEIDQIPDYMDKPVLKALALRMGQMMREELVKRDLLTQNPV